MKFILSYQTQESLKKFSQLLCLLLFIIAFRFSTPSKKPNQVFTKHYFYFLSDDPPIKFYVYNISIPDQEAICKNKYCDPNADLKHMHTFIFEKLIIDHLNNDCQTTVDDPSKADLYYVPIYFGAYNLHPKRANIKSVIIPLLKSAGKWYQENGGVDHIFTQMLFSHTKIPITAEVQKSLPAMITIGDIIHDYSLMSPREAWRITLMPYLSNNEAYEEDDYNHFQLERHIPAFFIGQTSISHFDPRARLVREQLAEELKRMRYAISIETERNLKNRSATSFNVYSFMKNTDFCPVPHGDGPASKRLYDAFKARCIPVLMSDEIRFPFENVFADYSGAVLQVPMYEADTIAPIIGMMTDDDKREMKSRIGQLTPLLNISWDGKSKRGDLIWGWKWEQFFKAATIATSKRRGLMKNKYYTPLFDRLNLADND